MSSKVMSISDARRLLPGLIRSAAARGPVTIGPRGHAAAVLLGVEEFVQLKAQAAQRVASESPWARLRLQPVGTLQDIEEELLSLRQGRATALLDLDAGPTTRPGRKRPAKRTKNRRPTGGAKRAPAQ